MKPIPLQLLDIIEARLANITVANGYSQTLYPKTNVTPGTIRRSKIGYFAGGDLPILFFWAETESVESRDFSIERRILPVTLAGFCATNDKPFVDVAFEFAADIRTALNRDVLAPLLTDVESSHLGDIVDSVNFDETTPAISVGDKPFCGVVISLDVGYRAKDGDCFNILN